MVFNISNSKDERKVKAIKEIGSPTGIIINYNAETRPIKCVSYKISKAVMIKDQHKGTEVIREGNKNV